MQATKMFVIEWEHMTGTEAGGDAKEGTEAEATTKSGAEEAGAGPKVDPDPEFYALSAGDIPPSVDDRFDDFARQCTEIFRSRLGDKPLPGRFLAVDFGPDYGRYLRELLKTDPVADSRLDRAISAGLPALPFGHAVESVVGPTESLIVRYVAFINNNVHRSDASVLTVTQMKRAMIRAMNKSLNPSAAQRLAPIVLFPPIRMTRGFAVRVAKSIAAEGRFEALELDLLFMTPAISFKTGIPSFTGADLAQYKMGSAMSGFTSMDCEALTWDTGVETMSSHPFRC